MAAILGVLERTGESRDGWESARSRLASRSGPWEKTVQGEGWAVAYRGPSGGGFYGDESHIVLADGFLDNLASLAREYEVAEGTSRAASLAQMVKRAGVEALYGLEGNFALAVVEMARRRVWLIRDRFGTTPLYYAATAGGWCWGSEIKTLLPLLEKPALNREALGEVFHYRWLAGQRTLVEGVQQVLPSHSVELAAGQAPRAHRHYVFRFQPQEAGDAAEPEQVQKQVDEALDRYLEEAAKRYPRVGILLSGGVDSSLLAAKAMRSGFRQCVAITGHLPEYDNPELPQAQQVAKHLGIEHLIVDVDDDFVKQFFPEFIWRMEEPPRHYHGFVVSKLFSRLAPQVDAVLYGEAADTMLGTGEVLWLQNFERKQRLLKHVPWMLRRTAAALLPKRGSGRLASVYKVLAYNTSTYLARMQAVENTTSPPEVMPGLPHEAWPNEDILKTFCFAEPASGEHYQELHLYTEVRSHLDTLDRLAEPKGLAILTPFLSSEVAAIGASLATSLKIRDGFSKPLLREIACRYFPREWIYAEKFGFPTPLQRWMKGPLRPWLGMLRESRTAARGLFRMEVLNSLTVDRDYQILWTALCLEMFIRQFLEGEGNSPRMPV